MCREGMPQRMRRDAFFAASALDVLVDDARHASRRQTRTRLIGRMVQEKCSPTDTCLPVRKGQTRTTIFFACFITKLQIAPHAHKCFVANRAQSFFVAFSGYAAH